MSNTKRQNQNERLSNQLQDLFGPNLGSKHLQTINRRIDKRKRHQFGHQPKKG